MQRSTEVEIKFFIENVRTLEGKLRDAGFRRITPRRHEYNTMYDLPGQVLRRRGVLLRLRQYGEVWTLTHKTKGTARRHKARVESETVVSNGKQTDRILRALGYRPSFVYEKYRAEWSDGHGHVVVDETPIGNIGEIEGKSRWIDATAKALGILPPQYVTDSYAGLFFAWKRRTRSPAKHMTFAEVRQKR